MVSERERQERSTEAGNLPQRAFKKICGNKVYEHFSRNYFQLIMNLGRNLVPKLRKVYFRSCVHLVICADLQIRTSQLTILMKIFLTSDIAVGSCGLTMSRFGQSNSMCTQHTDSDCRSRTSPAPNPLM